ncbi:hypothetical protein PGT21_001992 [Puccinia graminis f. sp. tritici]|uniref:Uncharacterized protein n=1 Tax=Puccinia graminis f. sp. tritici TaxID=56615 RepID=A0A5B0NKD7_PUCGR|nr:hypothetical protein PGTUg99_011126 [Puccinia graminis f. sp. tritici]KAA1105296.1 hypothetical protein PGT21_001992 [Puccinia graminis f. sp. tritici]
MQDSYPRLSIVERRKDLTASKAFDQLIDYLEKSPTDLDPAFRRSTIRVIILDLDAHLSGRTDWSTETTLRALVTLKFLGRSSIATDDLVSHLPLFTRYANLLPPLSPQSDDPKSTTIRSAFSPPIVQESLRILANALFLHPLSRSSIDLLPALSPLVELAAGPSDRSPNPSPQQNPIPFLASRLIFLITAVPSILVIEVIEKTELISCFERSFKHQLLNRSQSQEAVSHPSIPQDVLIEHLKIIFNLMVHYPKSVLQFGQPTSPTIGQSPFTSSSDSNGSNDPPVSPSRRASLKTRLMNQISIKKITRRTRSEASNIKEQEPLDQISAYQDDHRPSHSKNSRSPHNRSHSKTSNRVPSVDQDVEGLDNVIDPHNHVFAGLLPHLVQLFLLEPIPNPPNLKPPLTSFMHTFLNFLPFTSSFFIHEYTLPNDSNWDPNIPPVIAKLVDLIDQVTCYYCPGDPDDRSAKAKCHADSIDLEVDLTQIVLLTANLISPHTSPHPSTPIGLSKKSREALIERVVPSNIDRSVALNKQDNLIGRILRLMNSVGFESLKHTCGALLNALYAEDTDRLSSQVGYGPIAGYLLSIGKAGLNPDSKHSPAAEINPITGTYWPSGESSESAQSPMTEFEKEQEAERMCSLFDRMNRSGIISATDPRKLAVESGRFQEIEQSVDAEEDEEEKLEERKALRELELYKERKNKKNVDH